MDGDDVDRLLREGRVRTRAFIARIQVSEALASGFLVLPTFSSPHQTIVAERASGANLGRLLELALQDVVQNPLPSTVQGEAMGAVDIVCDVQQIDETGYAWTFLDDARDPALIVPGEIVIAGAEEEPADALVIDIVGDDPDRIVHLDILPGDPAQYHAAAERSRLADAT